MKLGKYIDNGTFSKVYEVECDVGKVVKIVRRYKFESELEKKLLDNEIKLCSKWPFGEILGLVRVFGVQKWKKEDGTWCIVMEHGGENLERFIMKGEVMKLSKMEKIGLMVDLLDAVEGLERLGFRHFDIKPKNIVVARDDSGMLKAKMCDYDMLLPVSMVSDLGCEIIGTQRYLPPVDSLDRSLERCIWSLGMVFYEIVHGKYFMGWKGKGKGIAIGRGKGSGDGSVFDSLLYGMLDKDKDKRFDIKDCKYEMQNLLVKIKSD